MSVSWRWLPHKSNNQQPAASLPPPRSALLPAVRSGSGGLAAVAALGCVAYTGVVGMTLWAYLATFWAEPGGVPRGWHPFQNAEAAAVELEAWERLAYYHQRAQRAYAWEGPEAGRAAVNRPRYCRKCGAWKPPRAHHDSMSGRCVLRMDHYCM